jgi:hypothetical protein
MLLKNLKSNLRWKNLKSLMKMIIILILRRNSISRPKESSVDVPNSIFGSIEAISIRSSSLTQLTKLQFRRKRQKRVFSSKIMISKMPLKEMSIYLLKDILKMIAKRTRNSRIPKRTTYKRLR